MDAKAAFVTYIPPLAMLWLMTASARYPWDFWRILGTLIVLISLALLTAARLRLGNSFSITAEARQLVTTGIYSKLRHPVYVFSSLLIPGLALYFKTPWLAAILIIILPMQFLRAREEEKVLIQAFGESYLTYRKTTWF